MRFINVQEQPQLLKPCAHIIASLLIRTSNSIAEDAVIRICCRKPALQILDIVGSPDLRVIMNDALEI